MLSVAFQKIYKKNNDYVARKIAGELVLIPLNRRLEDIQSIFNLNEVACQIWDEIDGQKSLQQISDHLIDRYEVALDQWQQDLNQLIQQLEAIKAIEQV